MHFVFYIFHESCLKEAWFWKIEVFFFQSRFVSVKFNAPAVDWMVSRFASTNKKINDDVGDELLLQWVHSKETSSSNKRRLRRWWWRWWCCRRAPIILACQPYFVPSPRLYRPAMTLVQFVALVFHILAYSHEKVALLRYSPDYSDSDRVRETWKMYITHTNVCLVIYSAVPDQYFCDRGVNRTT